MKHQEKRANGTTRVYTTFPNKNKADQSFRKDCDVNEIMRRYNKTGQISHMAKHRGVYADMTSVTDLLGAYEVVKNAQDAFMALPAQARRKFDNDPLQLEAWLRDPKNFDEAAKLGLLENVKKPQPPSEQPAPKAPKKRAPDKPSGAETDED